MTKPTKKTRGPVFWVVVAILGGAAVWWTISFIHHSIAYRETDDAYVQGHVHKVSARLAGDVTEVLVKDNDVVKKGQALAKLDPLAFQIALDRAKANLADAEAAEDQAAAAVDQAIAGQAQSEADTLQATTGIAQAQAQLDVSTTEYDRNKKLYGDNARAVSKSEVDTSQASFKAAKAALDGSEANREAIEAKGKSAEANVKAAQAQLASATAAVAVQKAAVSDAERELSYTTIVSPADGRIGNKNIETGNRVQVGQSLFAIIEPEVWVIANFKETQLSKIAVGQPVELTVDAFGARKLEGHVDSISPATGAQFALLPPDNATGNFTKVVQRVPVKIVFDAGTLKEVGERIHPGLSAVVNVRIR